MKKILLFLLLLHLCLAIHAQTPADEAISRMNYVFEEVNRSNVPTGLLSNYGVQPIPLEYYNGIPADSNFVDIDSYKLLYAGVYSAKFNNNITLITPDELSQQIQNYSSGGSIPVSVMHYKYNRIKDDAVEQGLVTVANDQIIEIAGKNPYETVELFAAGPKEVITEGGTVSFIFPSTLRITNINKAVQNLQIRFDENLAFENTGWNTAISHTYITEGIKKVRFKINYTDGTSFTSQTNIIVRGIPTDGDFRSSGPGDAAGIGGARYDISINSTSAHSGGTIQVKLATTNTTGKIQKALIIAEGFDTFPLLDAANTDLYSLLADPERTNFIIPEISNYDYDIVYVDNNNGIDDIKRNAALFMEALDKINSSIYRNDNASPNVVMGISMGGLVARYALRKMETENKDHKVWKYISIDSPHKGANVPVGFQAAARHLSSLDFKYFFRTIFEMTDIPMVSDALEVLNSPAAKQMLIYNVNDAGTGYDNSIHTTFLAEYEQLGFPQKCQNIAVSNGISSGASLFSPGSDLVDINYRYTLTFMQEFVNILLSSHLFTSPIIYGAIGLSNYPQLLLNIIPGKTQLGVIVNINAINTAPNSQVYYGAIKFHKKILWLINSSVTLTSSTLKTQSGMVPIDGISGGIIDLETYLNSAPEELQQYVKQDKFCFIPRGSALALNDWDTNYSANLQGQDLFTLNKTNFEHTIMPVNLSEFHVTFDETKQFVINQLTDKPISPNSFQSSFCGNQTVTVKNPLLLPLTWTVSDNTFSITSPTNTSAVISSAPIIKTTVLTIVSDNLYPLKKRLTSTCYLSISGPDLLCTDAVYSVNSLPQGATVVWSIPYSSSPYPILRNNYPAPNLCLISNTYHYATSIPLTAKIYSAGTLITTINKTITSDDNSTIQLGTYFQEACLFYNVSHPSISGSLNGEAVFLHQGCLTEISLKNMFGKTVTLAPGSGTPLYWDYLPNQSLLLLKLPYGSGGVPFQFKITGGCKERSILFFSISDNKNIQLSIYPNPASDIVTVELQESTDTKTASNTLKVLPTGKEYEIQLWDSTHMIRSVKTSDPIFQLTVSGLPSGIYFIRVIIDGEIFTKKLIKR